MTGKINYIEVSGLPKERGHQQGEAFRSLIKGGIEGWKEYVETNTRWTFEEFLTALNNATDYLPAIKAWSPDLLEEVEGIGKGADVPFAHILAWQLVDEWIDFVVEDMYAQKCSALGGFEQGDGLPPITGKTQDLPHLYLDRHAVVRAHNEVTGITVLHSLIAGTVASDGLNSAGLGVCLNHVGQLRRDPGGIPVVYIVNKILNECSTIDEARKYLAKATHASGMNYLLGDRHEVVSLEVSVGQLAEYKPAEDLKRVWHTNHPYVNSDYCENYATWKALNDSEAGNTEARAAVLKEALLDATKPLDAERAMEILRSRDGPVSSLPEDDFPTINALVIEHGEEPVLHFAPGAPSHNGFRTFGF